jgi:hypothetical protein
MAKMIVALLCMSGKRFATLHGLVQLLIHSSLRLLLKIWLEIIQSYVLIMLQICGCSCNLINLD